MNKPEAGSAVAEHLIASKPREKNDSDEAKIVNGGMERAVVNEAGDADAKLQNGENEAYDDYIEDEDEEPHPELDYRVDPAEADTRAPFPGEYVIRKTNPELPDTVTKLETLDNGVVYIVGTAHFSEQSQDDVSKTIEEIQPDIVVVELCSSRVNILQLDEETLLKEASNINMEKISSAIKQSGFVQGLLHLLLLSMSAHLTKQLGMAPGGEFRRAFKQAMQIPGCRVQLGDRPIQVTLRRALGSLSWWQKCKLAWALICSKDPISKEEVEKCKQKDLLEEMLREMTGEFPALSRVFVSERDMYLAHSLRAAARPIPTPSGLMPSVVVGVVGIGHVSGIKENWDKPVNMHELMRIPPPSTFSKVFLWTRRAVVLTALGYAGYKAYHLGHFACVYIYRNISDGLLNRPR